MWELASNLEHAFGVSFDVDDYGDGET